MPRDIRTGDIPVGLLAEVVNADLRRRHAARLVAMDGLELDDAGVMDGAWR